MPRVLLSTCFVLAQVTNQVVQATLPTNYLELAAEEKQALILSNLQQTQNQTRDYPSALSSLKLLWMNLRKTFEHTSDEMPSGRDKVIHPVGVTGLAKFVANPHTNFSGHFQGSDNLIIRLSSAGEPSDSSLKPGIAVKFLQDGKASVNVVALHLLEGQTSGNFFQESFSNHFPEKADPSFIEKRIFDRFDSVNHPASWVGCSDIAAMTPEGEEVSKIVAPFQLFFKPNAELSKDWLDVSPLDYLDKLVEIPSGTMLYSVYGVEHPEDLTKVKMGEIVLTSALMKSTYGDEKLFFQHQYIAGDFDRKPEWKETLPAASRDMEKSASGCPFSSKRSLRL